MSKSKCLKFQSFVSCSSKQLFHPENKNSVSVDDSYVIAPNITRASVHNSKINVLGTGNILSAEYLARKRGSMLGWENGKGYRVLLS